MKTKNIYPKIQITPNIRVSIENCFVIQEPLSKNQKTGELTWSNTGYFTSWEGLIKKLSTYIFLNNVNGKEIITFNEARKEYLNAVESLKNILTGDIDNAVRDLSCEIKECLKRL